MIRNDAAPAAQPLSAYMSAPDAARYLGVSASYFRAHIKQHIAACDFGVAGRKLVRYAATDLDAWAASRRKEKKSA